MALTLYCVDSAASDDLWIVNPPTPGSSTLVGTFPSGLANPTGLASHEGVLYCVNATGNDLWIVDTTTPSSSTLVGTFPSGLTARTGLASHEGVLYCVNATGADLWIVNPPTPGSSTLVGSFPAGLPFPAGLASHEGVLYCVDDSGDELWIVDTTTPSSSTLVGTFPSGLATPTGLASHEGVLYCVDTNGDELWVVDTTTPSSSTLAGAFPAGLSSPQGLASHDPDPAPVELDVAATFPGAGGTISAAVTLVSPLVLSDLNTTGLEVVAAALIEASGPGTSGNNLYADSDRGGSDTPVDGELGLGADNTVISRIRRLDANTLQLNDNDNPAGLNIGAYFAAGGAGNDLTVSLQTLDDGLVTFTVASQVETGGNAARTRFTLPTDAQTLLDNIATGDRFIIAFTRAQVVELDVAATFPGAGGTIAAAVTLVPPAELDVAATFPGAGGSLAAAVTLVHAAELPVAATFPGAGGSLAAAVTLVVPVELPVAATFPGVGGSLAAAVTLVEATGVWDIRRNSVDRIGRYTLPGVKVSRGGTVGRTGIVPSAGSLEFTLDELRIVIGDLVELLDDAVVVWTGVVRDIQETEDTSIHQLRWRVRATGPIAELVAHQGTVRTRLVANAVPSTLIADHLLPNAAWATSQYLVTPSGPDQPALRWWWADGHPWSTLLQLMRTAGPQARVWEDSLGLLRYSDQPIGTAVSRTLYGTISGSGARPIISQLVRDDAGRDRIINAMVVPYAVVGAAPLVGIQTSFPGASATLDAPALVLAGAAAYRMGPGDNPTITVPPAKLLDESLNITTGSVAPPDSASIVLTTDHSMIFASQGGSEDQTESSNTMTTSGADQTLQPGYNLGDPSVFNWTQAAAVSATIPGFPANATNVEITVTALSVVTVRGVGLSQGSQYSYNLERLHRVDPIDSVGAWLRLSRSGAVVTLTPTQTPGMFSGSGPVTVSRISATVTVTWQEGATNLESFFGRLTAGVVPDGAVAASVAFPTGSTGTLRSDATLALLTFEEVEEPIAVAPGDNIPRGTLLLSAMTLVSEMDATAVVTAPTGWTLVGESPGPLYLASQFVTGTTVPTPVWTVTGPSDVRMLTGIIAFQPEYDRLYSDSADREVDGTLRITCPLSVPYSALVPVREDLDFTLVSGALTAAPAYDDTFANGLAVDVVLTGEATINGMQVRGIAGRQEEPPYQTSDAGSVGTYGVQQTSFSTWPWIGRAAAEYAAAWAAAPNVAPRRAWEVLLDGSRNAETRAAALDVDVGDIVRCTIDQDFDQVGEVVAIRHRIEGAAGILRTTLTLLAVAGSAALSAPGVPTNVAGAVGSTTISFAWDAPASGGAVASYTLRYRPTAGSAPWTTLTSIRIRSHVIGGLTPNTEYRVQVQAVNVAGDSARVSRDLTTNPA